MEGKSELGFKPGNLIRVREKMAGYRAFTRTHWRQLLWADSSSPRTRLTASGTLRRAARSAPPGTHPWPLRPSVSPPLASEFSPGVALWLVMTPGGRGARRSWRGLGARWLTPSSALEWEPGLGQVSGVVPREQRGSLSRSGLLKGWRRSPWSQQGEQSWRLEQFEQQNQC